VGSVRLAGLAVIGSLGLASVAVTPVVLAAPMPQPQVRPSALSKSPSKPAPTVTKTKLKTVAPPVQCNISNGRPASEMTSAPWPQQKLNFTDVWPMARGGHVKVAVVDSGVDASDRQLPGVATYDVTGTGTRDCAGHGTMVAGIIAAKDRRNAHVPLLGAAPDVKLISVKVAVDETNNDPRILARGIRRAADLGAKIINVSLQTPDYPYLRSAVEYAQRAGALIVAAAGNVTQDKKASEQALYPASYSGVMSVGAVGPDGKVEDFTDTKSSVSIVAPGKSVISTWPGNSYNIKDGTSFAAPYVAATAALVKSYYPSLSAQQIKHRIEATADGGTSVGSGHGMVNPLRAVTAVLPDENAQAKPPAQGRPVQVAKPPHTDPFTRTVALSLVGGALGIAGAVVAGGFIIPAGRRRNWRPGRRAVPPAAED
jgi:membrane-anchored mycosin MYCP